MKMFFKIILIALIALLVTGCVQNVPASTRDNLLATNNDPIPTDTAPENLKFSTMYTDWPAYLTVEELMQRANNVFEGKLTQISFKTVSFKDPYSGETYTELYTIYEFEVSNSYKGKNVGKVLLGIPGGIEGYKVSEQYNALVHAGIYDEKIGITIMGGYTPPTIGESYLIAAIDHGNGFLSIPNPEQFIYSADRSDDNLYFGYQEIKDYFSKS